jgi:hypothetical protein
MLHRQSFGFVNFANAKLGDLRRTKRLVDLADQLVTRPGGTLPQKFRSPSDLDAFYRLMRCEQVTHETILQPHRQATIERIQQIPSTVLIIHDGSEFDFTKHKSLDKLGNIGCGTRRGYIVHNSLAVRAEDGEPLGLLNQILHCRAKVPKNESRTKRFQRKNRESRLWIQGNEPLPTLANCIDVCDRGADTYEYMLYETHHSRQFVIRSAHNRRIFIGHDDTPEWSDNLHSHLRSLEPAGTWQLQVTSKSELRSGRGNEKKKQISRIKRTANMAVSFSAVQLRPSKIAGAKFMSNIKLWCIRVWEVDPPEGQERLEWFLQTNVPVESFEKAYEVTGWYEKRWIIEEYHKGLKTGSRIESLQFTSESRLQPAIALLSITTLTLLQLRDASRRPDAKTRRASEVVDATFVKVLSHWRHKEIRLDWTVHDFYFALARLGGHLNRKHDHPPGWQVLWEGWKELLPMTIGYQAAKKM